MRIAYIIQSFPVRSQTFVLREVEALIASGVDVHVFTFVHGNMALSPNLESRVHLLKTSDAILAVRGMILNFPKLGTAHEIANTSSKSLNLMMFILRTYAVLAMVKKLEINHLHAHWTYATRIAMLAHESTGIPYSVSIHAHEVAHENQHFPIAFRSLKFASFCNRAAMDYLLAQLDQSAQAKSFLVYHGVDTQNFQARQLPPDQSMLKIISAGRLTKTKGFDRLIRACAETRKQGASISLTILGDGDEFDNLQALARELEFDAHLHMPGWVPHSDIPKYFLDTHLFALLADTNYHDGLPNVVLEAMASGRAVLLSNLPASGEAVTHMVNGFIIDSNKAIEETCKLLLNLAGNVSKLEAMGLKARERVVNEHDAQQHIQHLIELFEKYTIS